MPGTRRRPCFVLGVAEWAVMDVMGWSKIDMAQRYMPVPAELRQRIASQLGGQLWKAPAEDDDDGTAGAPLPA
jgi:integrase